MNQSKLHVPGNTFEQKMHDSLQIRDCYLPRQAVFFLSSSRGATFLSWNVDRDNEEENLSGVAEYSYVDCSATPLITS